MQFMTWNSTHINCGSCLYSTVSPLGLRQLAFPSCTFPGQLKYHWIHRKHGIASFKIPLHALHTEENTNWMAPERSLLKLQFLAKHQSMSEGKFGKISLRLKSQLFASVRPIRTSYESSQWVNSCRQTKF